jgi:hypothetical protein
MEQDFALARLTANVETVAAMVRGVPEAQARWKPTPEAWSILEVVCHLGDEEREDFRQRIDYILHRPGEKWPPIQPEAWVTARSYNERDVTAMLDDFLREREESLRWLRTLQDAPWERVVTHPSGGEVRAIDMLAAWVAHDHLHIRQLNELHWQFLAGQVSPESLDYAGGW